LLFGITLIHDINYFFSVDDLKAVRHLNSLEIILHILKREGVSSLYRGLISVMQSSCISNFVYFYVFHLLKSFKPRDAVSIFFKPTNSRLIYNLFS
jgi:hypothetical protein